MQYFYPFEGKIRYCIKVLVPLKKTIQGIALVGSSEVEECGHVTVSEGPKMIVGSVDNLQHCQLRGALCVAWAL